MGGRVAGKPKKKSIKANVTSKFGSKRKLSRMGKKITSGQMGPSTEFITRSTALKKLQITLKDFRRLCILKGIYPRVPVKAPKGSDKVYYDIKDISYLSHEPLLAKFREFKSFMKKIRKSSGRNQYSEARRKDALKPVMALDHLVKERYPRFIDALRDMDDALCMIHLFAAMPSQGRITVEHSSRCSQLVRHWQYYVAKSRSLHKVFVSVKGVYFQAEVMGEPVTWLVPHPFTQSMPREVDVRVMITFLEFYEVLMKFVLFKLYHTQGLRYPPTEDQAMREAGCFLLAIKPTPLDVDVGAGAITTGTIGMIEPKEQAATIAVTDSSDSNKEKKVLKSKINKESALRLASLSTKMDTMDYEEDEDDVAAGEALTVPLADAFSGLQADEVEYPDQAEQAIFSRPDEDRRPKLFVGLKLFVNSILNIDGIILINREAPLEWMQLCLLSHGAQLGWEGPSSPFPMTEESITHQIIDRPVQGVQSKNREYVQPQWVFDSINAQTLLPVGKYLPGVALPPHLSPFVDDEKEGYTPKYRKEIQQLQASSSASVVSGLANESETRGKIQAEEIDEEDEDEDDGAYERDLRAEKKGQSYSSSKSAEAEDEDEDDEDEGDDDDEDVEEEDDEVIEEAPIAPKGQKGVVHKPKAVSGMSSKNAEDGELAGIMMSKKTKRLYGRMQHGIDKKQNAVDRLEEKRIAIESSGAIAAEPLKKKQKGAAVGLPFVELKASKSIGVEKSSQKGKADGGASSAASKTLQDKTADKGTKRKR